MIRINLLPYRAARSKENIRKQISIFLLSFALLLVVLIVFNGYLISKRNNMTDRLDHLKKEVAIYKKKAKKVEEIKRKLNTLNKQIEVVKQLKAGRDKPPKLMAAMTETIITGRMQLTRLKSNAKRVALNGVALDNETIAVFMIRLERSGLFSDVILKSSKQVRKSGIKLKKFNIVCKKKQPKKPKKAAGKKGKKGKKKKK